MLRHTLATLGYRASKTFRGAPEEFPDFRVSDTSRTPRQILAHLGDLLDWALTMVQGRQAWHDSVALSWEKEKERFFLSLRALDDYLASNTPLGAPADRLFQGPVADALTHVGQIAMLRRVAGAPVRGENYLVADIAAGHVGPDQPPARREFD